MRDTPQNSNREKRPPQINPNPDFGYSPQPAQKPKRSWHKDKPQLFKQMEYIYFLLIFFLG